MILIFFQLNLSMNILFNYITYNNSEQKPEEEALSETVDEIDEPAKVILYDDEWHTFEEVISQIIKAISCDFDKAQRLTWEVHTKGKACVFLGDLANCLKVSGILEEISLHTEIEI